MGGAGVEYRAFAVSGGAGLTAPHRKSNDSSGYEMFLHGGGYH